MHKRATLLIVPALALLMAAGCSDGSGDQAPASAPTSTESDPGDTLDVEIGVVTDPFEPTGGVTPSPGERWVVATVVVENTGTETVDLDALGIVEIRDDQDRRWDRSVSPVVLPNGSLEGTLAPGERLQADVLFAVADDASGLEVAEAAE